MDEIRHSALAAAIAHVLIDMKASDEERTLLFSDVQSLERSVLMATQLLKSTRSGAELMADALLAEARAIWGEEAATQLAHALAARDGEAV